MIYHLYQAQADALAPLRMFARQTSDILRRLGTSRPGMMPVRQTAATLDLLGRSGTTHERPAFGFETIEVGNRVVAVTEQVVARTPFGALLHFGKDVPAVQPRVLVVAPMSGHFATLLRGTVKVLLPEHDVYITDWVNARDIPTADGQFDFDEFVAHVMKFLEYMGEGSHVIAVCQPAVAVLAAVAVMAAQRNRAQPRSMTLMAGPIDTRINPTRVNHLAKSRPITWFERNLIGTVPAGFRGSGRRVYPGFVQLSAFMSMNLGRHLDAHTNQFRALVDGNPVRTETHREFYDEYVAIMDLPAPFYLETVERVFQAHDLPLGRLRWRGEPVRPEAIRRTALLTVEGERDDICSIGQTMAALDLCAGLPTTMKRHYLQTGVGHYGVFSGRRWAMQIYPLVREMIQSCT